MTRIPLIATTAAVAVLFLTGAGVTREDPRKTADPGTFVEKALLDGMTEIELGELAQRQASSPEVKAFGARMVTDHRKVNEALTTLAKQKSFKVPAQLDAEHRAMIEPLRAKSGADFDAAYSQHMAADHTRAIDLYTQATQERDPQLAAFAKQTLPALNTHKKMADALVKATRTSAEPPPTRTRSQ